MTTARRIHGIGAALLLALGAASSAGAAPGTPEPAQRSANGLIVKLREPAATTDAHQGRKQRLEQAMARSGIGAARLRPVGRSAQRVDFGRRLGGAEAAALAAKLRELPQVEWVVPNEREQRLQVPQDPLFAASVVSAGQWWLFPHGGSDANDIEERRRGVAGMQSAWSTHTGSAGTVVAVLDTGVTAHPELAGHVLPGRDFVSTVEYANDGDGWDTDPSDPGDWVSRGDTVANPDLFGDCELQDSSWHGTTIAGQLAALTNNGIGGAAISWDGRVLPVRVAGKCGAEVADIIDGMRWAAGLQVLDGDGQALPTNPNPARIVNLSFGGSAACNAAYQDAIDELRAAGAVVVAAAGNASGGVARPANCAGVIGVAALNRDGFKTTYSNFGPQLAVATVGGDPREIGLWGLEVGDAGLLTLGNDGTREPGQSVHVRAAGTSFAAPQAAGVAALMLGVNPSLTAAQLIEGVRRSARPHVVSPVIGECSAQNPGRCLCTTATCGAGILDAPQALAYALDPAAYVAPARQPETIDNPEVRAAAALGIDLAPQDEDSGGSGGGALGAAWLLGLAAAAAALRRRG